MTNVEFIVLLYQMMKRFVNLFKRKPKIIKKLIFKSLEDEEPKTINKYTLKDPINFISNFLLELERRNFNKKLDEAKKIENERIAEIDLFEKAPPDEFSGRRAHSWIVIIINSSEDELKVGEDEETIAEKTAFFIEPSTGFRHEVDSSCYMAIDSIWNGQNYYVNKIKLKLKFI